MKIAAKKIISLLLVIAVVFSLGTAALAKTSSDKIDAPAGSEEVFYVKLGNKIVSYTWDEIAGKGSFATQTNDYGAKINDELTTQEWTGVMLADILDDVQSKTGIEFEDDYKIKAVAADDYVVSFTVADVKDADNRYMVACDPVSNYDGETKFDNSYVRILRGDEQTTANNANIRCLLFLCYCGLDESLPDSTVVKTIAKDGYDIRFTLGDLRSGAYCRYSYKGDDTADETGLPVIVAFASDGVPLVGPTGDEPVYKRFTADEGYDENADNTGGPLRLVVGQKNSYEFNAPNCSKWLAAIVVGDDNGYVYDRDTSDVADDSEPEQTGNWKHNGEYSDFVLKVHGTQANGVNYITLEQLENMTEGIDRGYYAASAGKNAYEGVVLRYLVEQYMTDSLERPSKITVAAADGYSKVLDVGLVWDGITSRYQPGKTKDVLLAYAIDGSAFVETADSQGYNGSNAFGPLRLVVENTISAWVKNVSEIIIGENECFDDMSGYRWAENAAAQLRKDGIIEGTGDNNFSPEADMRRGDFVLMLSRVFDFGQADGEGFEDVLPDSWWYNAVLSAQSVGIINGYDGRFMPYSSIKRQDAVVMIYRALLACGKAEAAPSEENSFKDGSSVSGYARTAVTALSEMGVIQGYNGYFRPNDTITRAEAAALIYRVKSL